MDRLRTILKKYYVPPEVFGTSRVNRDSLRAELAELTNHLRSLSWLTAAMICIVFIVEVAIAIIYFEQPAVLTGIAAAMGLTVAGAIEGMRRLSRETARTNIVISLVSELDSDKIAAIVNALVKNL